MLEQWGENTSLSADGESSGCECVQPHYCCLYQEAGNPLTDGSGHIELCKVVLPFVPVVLILPKLFYLFPGL